MGVVRMAWWKMDLRIIGLPTMSIVHDIHCRVHFGQMNLCHLLVPRWPMECESHRCSNFEKYVLSHRTAQHAKGACKKRKKKSFLGMFNDWHELKVVTNYVIY